ncbi:PhoU-like phosphate uptake regulator [Thiorhodovibrio winogradskyi]|uniref:Phosphate-specific transport system accessory protein PhoU n=1 Tax=Thiorhodovibrio winogradskyi TaxID=77007 RepID=A0ABZ0SBD4_9GAMM|nr:phosphate signaling complex protein PhoU [Thiorhodovibrio winogradskyi]
MTEPHTLKLFDKALDRATDDLLEMAESVSAMLERCLDTFLDKDCEAARQVIHSDLEIDRREEAIHAEVMDILARLQPVASDLRLVLAIERAASNLERVGDKAKNIAKRCLAMKGISPTLAPETIDLLRALERSVAKMLRDAIEALSRRSQLLATEVEQRDDTADELYDDLFHHAITQLQQRPEDAAANIHALFVGKNLERVGDHATNIAEEVHFILRGRNVSG